nr:hypothetical protein [Marinitoga lauensis]
MYKSKSYKKILYTTLFYIVVTGIILIIITPIYFLVTISLMSDQEAYDWPTRLIPSFFNHFRLEASNDNKYIIGFIVLRKKYM